jgi:integrase
MAIVKGEKRGRPGTWIADWRDGAQVRHWRAFQTKRGAEEFLDHERPRARQHTSRSTVNPRISVKDYAMHWLTVAVDQRPKLKPSTKAIYRTVVERTWTPLIGHVQVRKVQRETIRRLLLAELDKHRAPNTVALYLAVLTRMLRWAVREDHVRSDNPAAELGEQLGLTRERVSEDVLAFDRAERAAFLAAAREHTPAYFPIFFAMSRSGLRPSEARALQWGDYDPSRQVLMIRRTFGLRDILGAPKTRQSRRDVDVSPQLAEVLKRQRKAQAEVKLAGRQAELPEYIFTEPEGGPLARRSFERAFAVVIRKAGLGPQHSPKSLRHTYASLMISEGANLLYVARQLGHASVAITEKHYTRWIPQAVPAVHQLDDPVEAKSGSKGLSARKRKPTSEPVIYYRHAAGRSLRRFLPGAVLAGHPVRLHRLREGPEPPRGGRA